MTVIKVPGVKLPPQPPAEMPYLEPYPAPEFFCAELMRAHVHGAFTRLTFTTVDMIAEDPHAGPQNVAVCKIVVPTAALPALYEAIGKRLPAGPRARRVDRRSDRAAFARFPLSQVTAGGKITHQRPTAGLGTSRKRTLT